MSPAIPPLNPEFIDLLIISFIINNYIIKIKLFYIIILMNSDLILIAVIIVICLCLSYLYIKQTKEHFQEQSLDF